MKEVSLRHLELIHFKNHSKSKIDLNAKLVCITGDNGMGKTNILDAIYVLCMCKSYTSHLQSDMIQHEEPFARLVGKFQIETQSSSVVLKYPRKGAKSFSLDGKPYKKLKEHIGRFPVVIITPDDVQMFIRGSAERRSFLNNSICQIDKDYLEALTIYNHIVRQKSSLLKQDVFDPSVLDIYNARLSETAKIIYQRRMSFFETFLPLLIEAYAKISGQKEVVGLQYNSQLHEASLETLLGRNTDKERIVQRCLYGIHKDDMTIMMNDQTIKSFASQGQRKSLLLALKIAQFEYIRQLTDCAPLILLDDIFDKLDLHRVRQLIELLVKGSFGQIFITDTNKKRIEEAIANIEISTQWIEVVDGKIITH